MAYCIDTGAEFDDDATTCPGCDADVEPIEPGGSPGEGEVFLLSSFRDEEEGLVMAFSEDLLHWTELPTAGLEPAVGDEIMRDPFIQRDPDGTFHMVWTSGWGRRDIGYAKTEDLVEWSEQRLLPVMADEPDTKNCWAPKIFYDDAAGHWQIAWSSWVEDPERWGELDLPETNKNNRIWYTTTPDFEELAASEVLLDPGYSCIDAYLQEGDDEWLLFFKDGRYNKASGTHPEHQNIRIARSDDRYGPFGDVTEPITGYGPDEWHIEGPFAVRADGTYHVFHDVQYFHEYFGCVVSDDLTHWRDISRDLDAPLKLKHGNITTAPADLVAESFGLRDAL
ncbi:MAG: glycoside hydrolase family 43 protein [Halobacteriaceae archaeon]